VLPGPEELDVRGLSRRDFCPNVWQPTITFVASLVVNVNRSRSDAWRDDPRVAAIASDALLARYGYNAV